MSTRPSRTTRSSIAAAAATSPPAGPAAATRTRRTTTQTTPSTLPDPVRRTTRASRANTPGALPEVKVTQTRASIARAASNSTAASSSTRPLWTSTRPNVSTPPPAATPAVKRGTSLAVPGSSLRPKTPGSGLLARMTSRESLRQPKTPAPAPVRTPATLDNTAETYDSPREPIKAFLRIRPAPRGVTLKSYLQVLNETDVLMVPPMDHRLNPSSSSSSIFSNALLRSSHLHLNPASHPSGIPDDILASPTPHSAHAGPDPATYGSLFKFTSVFPPTSISSDAPAQDGQTQVSFFRATTLPLVRDFLQKGENCLLFAYGPTGSGKTWTVQGGKGEDAGLLPRVVDIVWKSLAGKRIPAGKVTPPTSRAPSRAGPPLTSTPTGPVAREPPVAAEDPESIPLAEGYEYSIWVSYSEIYNEKIYDLLEPLPTSTPSSSAPPASTGGGGMLKGLFRNFTTVKRSALSLKTDKTAPVTSSGTQQKIVGGLREIKVASAKEVHALLAQGQSNRRVFSTCANQASSRSHGIFTIKLVRASPATGAELSTSRFSIVDLAGSERVANTQTEGDRLKEAGNINKSLLCLGQCMEVLRKNQDRDRRRKPIPVPFRHSKLTQMFQSFLTGEGKAVMIVNINPYETGFDENSHVMKFSAVAKSVMTLKRGPDNVVAPVAPVVPVVEAKEVKKEPRVVRLSLIEGGEEEEVLYEEESDEDDDDEDEFVGALLDELSALRTALLEAQMNAVLAVSTVRTQLVKEHQAKMLAMDREYQQRRREEAAEAENKLNDKLDNLARLHAARTPARGPAGRHVSLTPSTAYDDSDEDDEGEEEDAEDDSEEVRGLLLPAGQSDGDASMADSAASLSPLAARVQHVSMLSPAPLGGGTSPRTRSPLGTEAAILLADEEGDAADTALEAPEATEQDGALDAAELSRDAVVEEAGQLEEGENELLQGEPMDGKLPALSGEPDDTSALSCEDDEDELASDDSDFVDDGEVDNGGSDADYEVSPKPSPAKKARSPARALIATPRHGDKENDALSPPEDDDAAYAEADEFGLEKSMVIRSGSKVKKAKRKLGAKVHDVDDLDTFEGVLSPIRKTPVSRSFKR